MKIRTFKLTPLRSKVSGPVYNKSASSRGEDQFGFRSGASAFEEAINP